MDVTKYLPENIRLGNEKDGSVVYLKADLLFLKHGHMNIHARCLAVVFQIGCINQQPEREDYGYHQKPGKCRDQR